MKQLLFLLVLLSGYSAISQVLLSQDFNGLNVGDLANQGGWSTLGNTPTTASISVFNNGVGNNSLNLTGASNAVDFKFTTYSLNLSSINPGNKIFATSFVFNTGSASLSTNAFRVTMVNASFQILAGFQYTKNTKIAVGIVMDSSVLTNNSNWMLNKKLGGTLQSPTDLVLEDNTTYAITILYDTANGKIYWEIKNNTVLVSTMESDFHTTKTVKLLNVNSVAGSANSVSSSVWVDDIIVKSRPCLLYDAKENSSFSYVTGPYCVGGANLLSTLVSNTATGIYSSTPAGLSINSTSGEIDLSASIANTYTVKFKIDNINTCIDSSTRTLIISDNIIPAFSIPQTICSGGKTPFLPITSTNSIVGNWSPTVVNDSISENYVFTPLPGVCAATKTIHITVDSIVVPKFSLPQTICSGGKTPFLPITSTNSIVGNWSPSVVNDSISENYVFTPLPGVCAATKTIHITVDSIVVPIFSLPSFICVGSVAPELLATSTNGVTGTWSPTTVSTITSGSYLFKPTKGSCSSLLSASIYVSSCAGLLEDSVSAFSIYPSPSSDFISISFSDVAAYIGTINFLAADGKLIEKRQCNNSSVEMFDVKSLNPGVYFFQIGNLIEKVVVQ